MYVVEDVSGVTRSTVCCHLLFCGKQSFPGRQKYTVACSYTSHFGSSHFDPPCPLKGIEREGRRGSSWLWTTMSTGERTRVIVLGDNPYDSKDPQYDNDV